MVFYLTQRLTGDRATAAVASLLFGLHPSHIEAVAWVSGVSEPLLAIFFIGSFLCYLKYRDPDAGKGRGWLAAALALAALAVFAKETGIVLPLMIFAYELIFTARSAGRSGRGEDSSLPEEARLAIVRSFGKALVRSPPFVAVTVLYLIARYCARGDWADKDSPVACDPCFYLAIFAPGLYEDTGLARRTFRLLRYAIRYSARPPGFLSADYRDCSGGLCNLVAGSQNAGWALCAGLVDPADNTTVEPHSVRAGRAGP
jgi:hypothetical protein